MTQNTDIMLLRDPDTIPSEQVIEKALGHNLFEIYTSLINTVTSDFNLVYEWRFYKDGNAWLCKITGKKKTIFWLSAWEQFVKTSFFFTEKTRAGIDVLAINPEIKTAFDNIKPVGKLIPLIIDISQKSQLADFIEILKYKISLK